jgi:hypothetical protein
VAIPTTPVHRPSGHFGFTQKHLPGIGLNESTDHSKRCGLPGAVWSEEADDFALIDAQANTIDDASGTE